MAWGNNRNCLFFVSAANIGAEFIGFTLLLISSALIGIWAYLGKHKGILFLQFFYATAGIIGMIRWF